MMKDEMGKACRTRMQAASADALVIGAPSFAAVADGEIGAPMRDSFSSVVCKKMVKKLNDQHKMIQKSCFCLAPIRVL